MTTALTLFGGKLRAGEADRLEWEEGEDGICQLFKLSFLSLIFFSSFYMLMLSGFFIHIFSFQ